MKIVINFYRIWLSLVIIIVATNWCLAQSPESIRIRTNKALTTAIDIDTFKPSPCTGDKINIPDCLKNCPNFQGMNVYFYSPSDARKYDCLQRKQNRFFIPTDTLNWGNNDYLYNKHKELFKKRGFPCYKNKGINIEETKAVYLKILRDNIGKNADCVRQDTFFYSLSTDNINDDCNCDNMSKLVVEGSDGPCDKPYGLGNCHCDELLFPGDIDPLILWRKDIIRNLDGIRIIDADNLPNVYQGMKAYASLIDDKGFFRNIRVKNNNKIKIKRRNNTDIRQVNISPRATLEKLTIRLDLKHNGKLDKIIRIPLDVQAPICITNY